MYYVYKLTHPTSDTAYVGLTNDPEGRRRAHERDWERIYSSFQTRYRDKRERWLSTLPSPPQMILVAGDIPTRAKAEREEEAIIVRHRRAGKKLANVGKARAFTPYPR